MIRLFTALALASAATAFGAAHAQPVSSTDENDILSASDSWWEKLIVTTSDGAAPVCRYQTSLSPGMDRACEVDGVDGDGHAAGLMVDEATQITFERRFSPGAVADLGTIGAGDTLLGESVIALAIDRSGKVQGCKVMSTNGTVTPDYGCEDAKTEQFEASMHDDSGSDGLKVGTMTLLVYAREEHYA